jgi:hypothetical protein
MKEIVCSKVPLVNSITKQLQLYGGVRPVYDLLKLRDEGAVFRICGGDRF